jgi:hypothetical protein
MGSPQRETLHRGLAALTMRPMPFVVSPEFFEKAGLIMTTVVVLIRREEPDGKMYFPSARRSQKNKFEPFDKIRLNVYDGFDIVHLDRTSVRDASPPKS